MRVFLRSGAVVNTALMLFAAVLAFELQAQAQQKPLWTQDQIIRMLKGDVPSKRVETLTRERGIGLPITSEAESDLRTAGATDSLPATLRELATKLPVETPRGAVSTSPVGTVEENPKDGLKYVWIPPGSFQMGCSPRDTECYDDEKPAHHVSITKGFWIGQTEVTVGAYKRFAGSNGKSMPTSPKFNEGWSNEQMPIGNVTWNDAQAFCQWAGGRLPTEAEWEYAARGGNTEVRYGPIDEVAWWYSNSGVKAHDVGKKPANGFGLFDTLGNVWEWVNDWYDAAYYKHSPSADPSGPSSGTQKVLRGGAWPETPQFVRASVRHFRLGPGLTGANLGFRCVGEMDKP